MARRGARERRDRPGGPRRGPGHGCLRTALPEPPRRRDRHDLPQRPGRQRGCDPRVREARLFARRRLPRGRALLTRHAEGCRRVSTSPTRVLVVGGGAAGLASAAVLRRSGAEVTVLERGRVGGSWEARYDCLHLHTVRWLSGLPGHGMPRASGKWPSRDGVADYLREYAAQHDLDLRTDMHVDRIERDERGWAVHTATETHNAR